MTPDQIISGLSKKGIQISHNGEALTYWPIDAMNGGERDEVKKNKGSIIRYLRGLSAIHVGDPVTTAFGNKNVWAIYPELGRVGTIDSDGLNQFYAFEEIASVRQFRFLKRRFELIESYVYRHSKLAQNEALKRFQSEWVMLFEELNRQQHLIEKFCGPLAKHSPKQREAS